MESHKLIPLFALVMFLSVPLSSSAAIAAPWYATSTTSGYISPTNINGTQQAISITSTGTSTIANDNTVLWVPIDFATNGCAGDSSKTDFGACVNALVSLGHTQGYHAVVVKVPDITVPSSKWSTSINPGISGLIWSLQCVNGAVLTWGGTGTSTVFDMSNPTGHEVSDDYGCEYRGNTSLIAAGQTNLKVTGGIYFGGSHGAVNVNFHDNTVNGFGIDIATGANAYMLNLYHNAISGGNGTTTPTSGWASLLFVPASSNSGERLVVDSNTFTDPGNLVATSSVYITNAGNASMFITNNSFDDSGLRLGASDGEFVVNQNHFENSDGSAYPGYFLIENPSSDKSTEISFSFNEIANDFSGANTIPGIIDHGGQLVAIGNHIDNYGGGTIPWFAKHANDNGVSSELICQTQVQGGALTDLVQGNGNVSYSLATGAACITDSGNSYPAGLVANSNNVNDFISGTTNEGTYDHSGNWTLGIGSGSTITINNKLAVTGLSTLSGGFLSQASSTFTTLGTGSAYTQDGLILTHATTSASVAFQDVWRDGNGNVFANNFVPNLTSTASNNGTLVLTPASSRYQLLTGTSNHTYQMPNGNASGMNTGATWEFNNNSTGVLHVQTHGGAFIADIPAGGYDKVILTDNSTSEGLWETHATLGHLNVSGAGTLGLGTSTPWADLSVAGSSGGTNPTFTVSTSTASATSTAFIIDQNGNVGVGTSSPPVNGFTIDQGTFFNPELVLATSTSMSIGIASSTNQLVRYGTSAITLTISPYQLIPGMKTTIRTCDMTSGTGGAITWSNLHYSGGVQPGNTTTANQCDAWYIDVTNGTSTAEAILTGMTPGIQ